MPTNLYRRRSRSFSGGLSFDILWLCPIGWVKDLPQWGLHSSSSVTSSNVSCYKAYGFLTHWGRSGSFKVFKRPFPGILTILNTLNAELNPICYMLALLAHHFLHVSRIRVKSLTLRLLMSYIYIYIWSAYSWCF